MRIPQFLRPQHSGVVTLALFFGTTAAALALAWRFHFGVPVTAAAIIVGVPALYLGLQGLGDRNDASLATIADRLADKINDQWSKEDAVRGSTIATRFLSAGCQLIQSWSMIGRQ